MKKERLEELVRFCVAPDGFALTYDIRNALLAVERETVERCAIAAWSAGMLKHNQLLGMPGDARDIGSSCANAIRSLLTEK